jgi:hypothetical protein
MYRIELTHYLKVRNLSIKPDNGRLKAIQRAKTTYKD